jgi:hypothetical protein
MSRNAFARDMLFCEQKNESCAQKCLVFATVGALASGPEGALLACMVCLRFCAAELQLCYQQAADKNGTLCQGCDACGDNGSCQDVGQTTCGQTCCSQGTTCCGTVCSSPGQPCCPPGYKPCGGHCIVTQDICCPGQITPGFFSDCPPGSVCCGDGCCFGRCQGPPNFGCA